MKFRDYVTMNEMSRVKGLVYHDNPKKGEVIAELEGDESKELTALAKKLEELHIKLKEITPEFEDQKKAAIEIFPKFFDEKDELIKRVVRTKKGFEIAIHAAAKVKKEKFDFEAFKAKLIKMKPDMEKLIVKLEKDFTEVEETERRAVVKVARAEDDAKAKKESVQMTEGVADIINAVKEKIVSFFSGVFGLVDKIDKQLQELADMLPNGDSDKSQLQKVLVPIKIQKESKESDELKYL